MPADETRRRLLLPFPLCPGDRLSVLFPFFRLEPAELFEGFRAIKPTDRLDISLLKGV